jgi:hypothetical protein
MGDHNVPWHYRQLFIDDPGNITAGCFGPLELKPMN